MTIAIDLEFSALIPPLADEELAQLEENLRAEGCREALVVWRGRLLDGHNRLTICEKYDLAYETREIDLPDRDAAIVWICRNQLGRRNLSTYAKGSLGNALLAHLPNRQGERTDLTSSTTVDEVPIKVAAEVAGTSDRTLTEVAYLEKHAPDAVIAKLETGEMSPRAAYRTMKTAERLAKERLLESGDIDVQASLKAESFGRSTVLAVAAGETPATEDAISKRLDSVLGPSKKPQAERPEPDFDQLCGKALDMLDKTAMAFVPLFREWNLASTEQRAQFKNAAAFLYERGCS